MHDDGTPVLPSLTEFARATIVGLRSSYPQSKDLRQHLVSFNLYGQETLLSGHSPCPAIPRIQYHLLLVVHGLIAWFLMLTYATSLQWPGS